MALGKSNANCLQRKILPPLIPNITNTDFKYNRYHKIKDNQVTKNITNVKKQKQKPIKTYLQGL